MCIKRWLTPLSGLTKNFPNTYEFWNDDIEKFMLLIEKMFILTKQHFLIKKLFYSTLNPEVITDEYYIHAQKVFEKFN